MKRISKLLMAKSPVGFVNSRSMTFVILFFSEQVANFHEAKIINCTALYIPIPVIITPEH